MSGTDAERLYRMLTEEPYQIAKKKAKKLVTAWGLAYPKVDHCFQVGIAYAWEVANPKRAKKDKARYLNSWLGRAEVRRQQDARKEEVDLGLHETSTDQVRMREQAESRKRFLERQERERREFEAKYD